MVKRLYWNDLFGHGPEGELEKRRYCRSQFVLALYEGGQTYRQIGARLHVGHERVRQLVYRGRRLRECRTMVPNWPWNWPQIIHRYGEAPRAEYPPKESVDSW